LPNCAPGPRDGAGGQPPRALRVASVFEGMRKDESVGRGRPTRGGIRGGFMAREEAGEGGRPKEGARGPRSGQAFPGGRSSREHSINGLQPWRCRGARAYPFGHNRQHFQILAGPRFTARAGRRAHGPASRYFRGKCKISSKAEAGGEGRTHHVKKAPFFQLRGPLPTLEIIKPPAAGGAPAFQPRAHPTRPTTRGVATRAVEKHERGGNGPPGFEGGPGPIRQRQWGPASSADRPT